MTAQVEVTLAQATRRLTGAFEGIRVALRGLTVFYGPREAYRRRLMGPRRAGESRAAHARRHRELAAINRRNRRLR